MGIAMGRSSIDEGFSSLERNRLASGVLQVMNSQQDPSNCFHSRNILSGVLFCCQAVPKNHVATWPS